MPVFVIEPDNSARQLRRVTSRNEDLELQQLLERNPDLLPGYQIRPEDPCRWLLVKRELTVPDPSTGMGRWSVDHVFADQHAIPTLVECKRFEDSGSRREVVGQMLEYAANGHFYWSADYLLTAASSTAEKTNGTLEDALAVLEPTVGSTPEEFFSAFVENLRVGRVRLVFFLEKAPAELKSIVDFLNRQMERAEVLLVEAQQYEIDGRRLVIPSLFGYTEEARRAKRQDPAASRKSWNKESFFADASNRLGEGQLKALERLFQFAHEQGFEIRWGAGQMGSFKVAVPEIHRRTLFVVYSNGRIAWYFGFLEEDERTSAFGNELLERLTADLDASLPATLERRFTPIPAEVWVDGVGTLESLLVELIERHRK